MNDLLKKAKEGTGSGKHFQGQVETLAHSRAEVAVLNVVFQSTYGLPRKINQLRLDLLEVACAKQAHTPLSKRSSSYSKCYCCNPYELGDCHLSTIYDKTMPVKQIEIERFTYETTEGNAEASKRVHSERILNMRERNQELIKELSQVVQELKDLESILDGELEAVVSDAKPKVLSKGAAILEQLGPAFTGRMIENPK